MRAREPDIEGYVERRGVKVGYEVFGDGDPTILLLPTWAIVHSRSWKAQVPFLARRYRVITYDPRGNGRSDRPDSAEAYSSSETIEDAVAVLDATGTDAAIVVGLSMGGGHLLGLAARHPERVLGAVFVAAALGLEDSDSSRPAVPFEEELDTDEGWAKFNMPYWRRDWPGFVDFFMERMLPEPHSTKQFEDMVGWGLETDPETIIKTKQAAYLELDGVVEPGTDNRAPAYVLADRITCPSLVVHGTRDRIIDMQCSERLAEALGCELVTFEGSGHVPNGRDPVPFNLLLRDFIDRVCPPAKPEPKRWVRAQSRSPRALYLSSPIGLGHALRDVSIAPSCEATARPRDRLAGAGSGDRVLTSGESNPPGLGGSRASPRTSRASRGARPALLPGATAEWTRSSSPTSTFFRTSSRRAPTTLSSATRPGTSTTSGTRTPS